MTTHLATQDNVSTAQRGRLNLSRYVGESVLIYPKRQHSHLPASALFSVPLTLHLEQLDGNCAHFKITADKRLVVVRDEIFKRNNSFQPQSSWTEDALRRAFYETAREYLDEQTFKVLHEMAVARIG